MTVGLDDRQRAMLAEMGVRIWWPAQTPASQEAPATIADARPNPLKTIKSIAENDHIALDIVKNSLISGPADPSPAPAVPALPDVGTVDGLDWPALETPKYRSRKAARVPRKLERNSRRAIRPTMRIDSVPSTATENRQPHEEVGPKSHSPNAMTHLPTGGCTTMSPLSVMKTLVLPWVNSGSTTLPSPFHRISTP